MSPLNYAFVRECQNADCKFRFPDPEHIQLEWPCPVCQSPTNVAFRLDLLEDPRPDESVSPARRFTIVLDNLRSVYNVGSIFRTMQGFAQSKVFLCGITPSPSHPNFAKTSMGAEKTISWEKVNNAVEVCKHLKNDGYKIVSLEYCVNAVSLEQVDLVDNIKKTALVIGNEVCGIDREVLDLSDLIVSIPIHGNNKSYNVTVAFGIMLYRLLYPG